MSTFDEVPDNYLMTLATAVAERLRADGERCTVKPRHNAVNVLVQRDDGEQQGLWFSASRYGRAVPQSVNVHGLWPLYEGRENSPYSGAPTVSVSYGREPEVAAKDVLRRFLPMYLPKWEQALASTVGQRDRDAKRDVLADQLRRMPGVDVWRGQSKERIELRWPGAENECLMLTVYGGGTVNIERGTLREDRLLNLLRSVSQVSEPEAEYGDPFRPCSLCGCTKSETAIVLNGVLVEPWEYHGTDERILCCTECSAPLRNLRALDQMDAAEPRVLYGEAKRASTYLKNDATMVLDRLMDLHVVLHRHKCVADYTGMNKWQKNAEDARVEQAFVVSKMKIALELKLRNAELVHDSINCRIGNMECVFRFTQLPALIRSYRSNLKHAV